MKFLEYILGHFAETKLLQIKLTILKLRFINTLKLFPTDGREVLKKITVTPSIVATF